MQCQKSPFPPLCASLPFATTLQRAAGPLPLLHHTFTTDRLESCISNYKLYNNVLNNILAATFPHPLLKSHKIKKKKGKPVCMEIQSDLSYTCTGICFTWQKNKGLVRARDWWDHQQGPTAKWMNARQTRMGIWTPAPPATPETPQPADPSVPALAGMSSSAKNFPSPTKGAGLGYSTGQLMFVKCSFLPHWLGEKPSLLIPQPGLA